MHYNLLNITFNTLIYIIVHPLQLNILTVFQS